MFGSTWRVAPGLKDNLINRGSNPVPATTFVITHSPSRSNRWDGFSFSGESGTGRRSRSGCLQHYQIHPDGGTSALDRTSREATLSRSLGPRVGAADLCRRANRRLIFLPRIWGAGVRISSGAPLCDFIRDCFRREPACRIKPPKAVGIGCGFRRFLTRARRRSRLSSLDSLRRHDEPSPAKAIADG